MSSPYSKIELSEQKRDPDEEVNEFAFEKICYSAINAKGKRKQILDVITGSAKSGEVLAILGPSGAGKTSLLNVLILNAFGKDAEITGKCTLNGELLTSQIFRRHFCVVPQEDTHRAFLTCRETLRYAADFYMSTSEEEKTVEVDKVLDKLGLADCADTRVGNQFVPGLSGGQKKRLSIGLALLKKPSVLILDEPTSGLDAAASYHVMGYIRELAAILNIIVIVTIHQPASSIYLKFDKVLLLSKGATAFLGTPKRSVEYFNEIGYTCPPNTNPAEFLLDVVNNEFTSNEQVESILDKWEANEEKELISLNSLSSSTIQSKLPDTSQLADLTPWQEFIFVGSRQFRLVFLDPMLYAGRAVMFLMACTFFAVIYVYCRDRVQDQVLNRLWLIMWLVGVPTSLGVIGVYAFNEEYKTICKEVKNGMFNVWSFLTASFMLQIPIMFILAMFIDAIPGFAIANFYGPHFVEMTAMYASILFAYECIARMFSVAFGDPLMGMLSYLNVWFTSFLFAGVMIPEDQVIWPFRMFFFIMPLKWSISTLAYLDAIDATYGGATLCPQGLSDTTGCLYHRDDDGNIIYPGWTCGVNSSPMDCYGRTGEQILESLGKNYDAVTADDQVAMNFGVIIAIGVAYQVGYMILAAMKAANHSKITYVENQISKRSKNNSSDDLAKLVASEA